MIGEIRQNFTEASASVGLILATALAGQRFKQYLQASFWFPSRHPEDKILTEPQPKKAKLLC